MFIDHMGAILFPQIAAIYLALNPAYLSALFA